MPDSWSWSGVIATVAGVLSVAAWILGDVYPNPESTPQLLYWIFGVAGPLFFVGFAIASAVSWGHHCALWAGKRKLRPRDAYYRAASGPIILAFIWLLIAHNARRRDAFYGAVFFSAVASIAAWVTIKSERWLLSFD